MSEHRKTGVADLCKPAKFTFDQVEAAMRQVVVAAPANYIDKSERYFTEQGKPSCLIGHVLHRLGAVPGDLQEGLALRYHGQLRDLFDPIAWEAMDRAQALQDDGSTWSKAYAHFVASQWPEPAA